MPVVMQHNIIPFVPINFNNQLTLLSHIFSSYFLSEQSSLPPLHSKNQAMYSYVKWLDNQACPPCSYQEHPIDSEVQLNEFRAMFGKVCNQALSPLMQINESNQVNGQSLSLANYIRIKRAYYFLNTRFNANVVNTNIDATLNEPKSTSPHLVTENSTKKVKGTYFNAESCEFSYINTPIGMMLAIFSDNKLCLLEFLERKELETELNHIQQQKNCHFIFKACQLSPIAVKLQSQLYEYFSRARTHFDIPMDTTGTEFQQEVWQMLQDIEYGITISYQQEAETMGKPTAMRAVANANGKNKISILIPCHRVIRKSGDLGGYGGGLWRKRYLLSLETGKVIE